MRIFLILCALVLLQTGKTYSDTVLWKGTVSTDGTPTHPVQLELRKQYRIKVNGTVNLGKWWKQGKPLSCDSCYEFAEGIAPTKVEILKNTMNISVCEGKYNNDHIYQSAPFIATQNRLHFWIHDTDYTDNSGVLQLELIEVSGN